MWPNRRLCDLLGILHPIIQAPMTGTCTPELASSVSNAGGLGSLGCAEKSLETILREVSEIKERTDRPYNLNFFVGDAPTTNAQVFSETRQRIKSWYDELGLGDPPTLLPDLGPGFDGQKLDLILDLKPAVVSFHFGHPDSKVLKALKKAGIVLISSATCVAEARVLEDAGFDAIIAQGWEAGGHRGSHVPTEPWDGVGTIALVPQIVDAVSVPVIAAGGIADGRGIVAAMALGASGVQMGTAFLGCPEAGTDPARRRRLRTATDRDTMVTDAISGRSARAARSRFAEEWARSHEPLPEFRQMYALSGPILKAADDEDASFFLYGQAAALTRELGAGALIDVLCRETERALADLRSK